LKKPTDLVRFRFYKSETEKTEPNQNQKKSEKKIEPNRKKKLSQNQAKPKKPIQIGKNRAKIEPSRKNQIKPV
jgi:hypothetical protein